jgi:hypothetical protein
VREISASLFLPGTNTQVLGPVIVSFWDSGGMPRVSALAVAASQFAVISFVAAVDGYLREQNDVPGLRITKDRAVNGEGHVYLQQVCGYIMGSKIDWRGVASRCDSSSLSIRVFIQL